MIQGFQETEDLVTHRAPKAFLGNLEKKEILYSYLGPLKVFRETEGSQDFQDYQDLGV